MRRAFFITLAAAGYAIAGTWTYYEWWVPRHAEYVSASSPTHAWWVHLAFVGGGIAIAVAATIVACSQNIYRIRYGKVVDWRYRAAYDTKYTEGGITVGGFGTGVPLGNGLIRAGGTSWGGTNWGGKEKVKRHDARYYLKLEDPATGRKGWVEVSEETYQAASLGMLLDTRQGSRG